MCSIRNFLVVLAALFAVPTVGAQKLLPFQGVLTDSNGAMIADGVTLVQFKIYDAPVGGNVVWSGEVHRLTVNNGLVSTVLGTKASLELVDFGATRYMEIGIDADNDEAITVADPPLLPRQLILPAVFAVESQNTESLNGHNWSALMVDNDGAPVNDPIAGLISGGRILVDSIPSDRLSGNISGENLEPKTVHGEALADGTVTIEKLASPVVTQNAPAGGVANSAMTEVRFEIPVSQETTGVPMKVPGLSVSLETTGRSVLVKILPRPLSEPDAAPSNIGFSLRRESSTRRAAANFVFALVRDGEPIAKTRVVLDLRSVDWPSGTFANNIGVFQIPLALEFIDLDPPAGQRVSYELEMLNEGSSASALAIQGAMMVAYEL